MRIEFGPYGAGQREQLLHMLRQSPIGSMADYQQALGKMQQMFGRLDFLAFHEACRTLHALSRIHIVALTERQMATALNTADGLIALPVYVDASITPRFEDYFNFRQRFHAFLTVGTASDFRYVLGTQGLTEERNLECLAQTGISYVFRKNQPHRGSVIDAN